MEAYFDEHVHLSNYTNTGAEDHCIQKFLRLVRCMHFHKGV